MTDCTVDGSLLASGLASGAGDSLGEIFRMPGDWLLGLAMDHGWSPGGLGCESLEAVSTMLSLVAWSQAAILLLLVGLALESRLSAWLRRSRSNANGRPIQRSGA
jgi:hypothetical protein